MSQDTNKHDGQRPLSAVEVALEAEAILSQRPRGMPPLSEIRTELTRLGFPLPCDADDVYDRWMMNGFRTRNGPVRDWRASLRMMARRGWLFSQTQHPTPGPLVNNKEAPIDFTPPTEAEVLAYAKQNKWTGGYGKWCYQWFIGRDWRYYGRPITSTAQWQALMTTELMDRAPR